MKEELYLYTDNGREPLDLSSPSGITLKWTSNLFGDLSKLSCSYSYTFKLPLTARNTRLLGAADDIRTHTAMKRIKSTAEFLINGISLCPNANLYLSDVSNTGFSCVLTWNILTPFETLKSAGTKLNELPTIGKFIWQSPNETFSYGSKSNVLSNTDEILYPFYDAGIPFENDTPPKPVVPVYRLIQRINDFFGVHFDIGRALSGGMGMEPTNHFNNAIHYGHAVYDDFITYGAIPITGITPFIKAKMTLTAPPLRIYHGLWIDGTATQQRVTSNGKEQVFTIDYTKLHIRTGIASIDLPRGASIPSEATLNDYYTTTSIAQLIEYGDFSDNHREATYSFIISRDKTKNIDFGGIYRKDIVYTEDNVIGRALKCSADSTLRGAATVLVSKEAVTQGRVQLTDYRYIYLLEGTRNEKDISIDNFSDEGDDFLGFRSYKRLDNATHYIYYFDFGDIYEQRKVIIDQEDDKAIGLFFWAGHEYTPITSADTEANNDVRFGEIRITSLTPNEEAVTTLPAYLDITANLPDISCYDFLKDLFFMNGAIPHLERDGRITAIYYDQLRDNVYQGHAIDWSQKLLGGANDRSTSVKYQCTNFSQHNYLEMASSTRSKSSDGLSEQLDDYGDGYGTITIADRLLDQEKSIYTAKFFNGLRRDLAYPSVKPGRTIKVWDGSKALSTTTNPIYGYLNLRHLNPFYEDTDHIDRRPDNATSELIHLDTYEPFSETAQVFDYLRAILENFTQVKEKFLLSETDLRDFNEAIPVYLHKYNAFFAVSTIQRDKSGISTVELIKLPRVTPHYEATEESPSVRYLLASAAEVIIDRRNYETGLPTTHAYDYTDNGEVKTSHFIGGTIAIPVIQENGDETTSAVPSAIYNDNDLFSSEPYSLTVKAGDTATYRLIDSTGRTQTYTTPLRVYLDDQRVYTQRTIGITIEDEQRYHDLKLFADIYDFDGNIIEHFHAKTYIFNGPKDESIIAGPFGDLHTDDEQPFTPTSWSTEKTYARIEVLTDLTIDNDFPDFMAGTENYKILHTQERSGLGSIYLETPTSDLAPYSHDPSLWPSNGYTLYLRKPTATAVITRQVSPVRTERKAVNLIPHISWDNIEIAVSDKTPTAVALFTRQNADEKHRLSISFDITDTDGNIIGHGGYATDYHVSGYADITETISVRFLFDLAITLRDTDKRLSNIMYYDDGYVKINSTEQAGNGRKIPFGGDITAASPTLTPDHWDNPAYTVFSVLHTGQTEYSVETLFERRQGEKLWNTRKIIRSCHLFWDDTEEYNLYRYVGDHDTIIKHIIRIEYGTFNFDGSKKGTAVYKLSYHTTPIS